MSLLRVETQMILTPEQVKELRKFHRDHACENWCCSKSKDYPCSVPNLLNTLEAYQKVAEAAKTLLGEIYDESKNDCTVCDTFLSPCKPTCSVPDLDKALSALGDK